MIEFTIPGLRLQSLNAREHWTAKAKRVKVERAETWLGWLNRRKTKAAEYRPPCIVTITRIGPRFLDSDNLVGSAKHVRDEIASCIGVDDNDPRITWNVEQEKGPFGVRVRIETATA